MRYGFAIDQRSCIGCHACTVACKTEHEIPVGQFRTWVSYVDKGEYPAASRAFAVLRCNHCSDAPCVKICPTKALFKRPDGIVDFDSDRCIGCKSCMQGCPYDAIYIDEDTHTAAKCNYCAHRVDDGLEPACVVVCPTHSIWAGDLDDPASGIARLVATHETAVRAPEQNTGPNVFYLGADRTVLDPLLAPVDAFYLWGRPDPQRLEVAGELAEQAGSEARTTLNTAHPRPWGWRVETYLLTKGIGAGALLVAAGAALAGAPLSGTLALAAPVIAVTGTAVTGVLLVWDLKRPERFFYIFTKANPTSWLFLGSVALLGLGAVAGGWLAVSAAAAAGVLPASTAAAALRALGPLAVPVAGLGAGYTGWLFNQAEGRDLWQSPALAGHLVVQAALCGSGALLGAAGLLGARDGERRLLARVLCSAAVAHLGMIALEHGRAHATRHAAAANSMLTRGRYAKRFWGGAVGLTAAAGSLALTARKGRHRSWAIIAGVAAQVAVYAYESAFVRAGQDVPLS